MSFASVSSHSPSHSPPSFPSSQYQRPSQKPAVTSLPLSNPPVYSPSVQVLANCGLPCVLLSYCVLRSPSFQVDPRQPRKIEVRTYPHSGQSRLTVVPSVFPINHRCSSQIQASSRRIRRPLPPHAGPPYLRHWLIADCIDSARRTYLEFHSSSTHKLQSPSPALRTVPSTSEISHFRALRGAHLTSLPVVVNTPYSSLTSTFLASALHDRSSMSGERIPNAYPFWCFARLTAAIENRRALGAPSSCARPFSPLPPQANLPPPHIFRGPRARETGRGAHTAADADDGATQLKRPGGLTREAIGCDL
ncbi:hypothetical protein BC628DRAFT_137382 [Trametes gibbosa]|nr:hypothetical protein BC628DRAFT_137382 [Trametes gibbosa]